MQGRTYSNISEVGVALAELIGELRERGETSLPSERALSETLGCNRKTLRGALARLDAEGVTRKLARERVLAAAQGNAAKRRDILLIAPTDESVHDPILSLFHQAFAANDEIVLRVVNSLGDPVEVIRQVGQMVETGVDTAFVVGNSVKLAALERFSGRMRFYRLRADDLMRDAEMPGVFVDYHHGARIGVKHLVDTGRRRILAISIEPEHQTHVFADFERGCLDAARDAGGGVSVEFFRESCRDFFNNTIDAGNVKDRMKGFDAVFACEDYRLVKLHNLLIGQGVKIADDIALLGFKDTPWATALHPQLSSISTQDSLLVAKAIEMMEQRRSSVELVKPVLVVRESTRPKQDVPTTSRKEMMKCV